MKKADRNEPTLFPEFWAIWKPHARHTDGRGLARDAFRKHVLAGVDPQDIVDGAACFFRTMKERDREFVPLSATWINRTSYEDLAEQEREYQARLSQAKERPANVVEMKPQLPANHFLNRYQPKAG